jgi:hypothetical protein
MRPRQSTIATAMIAAGTAKCDMNCDIGAF